MGIQLTIAMAKHGTKYATNAAFVTAIEWRILTCKRHCV